MHVDLTKAEITRLTQLLMEYDDKNLLDKLKLLLREDTDIPDSAGTVTGIAEQVTAKYKDGF